MSHKLLCLFIQFTINVFGKTDKKQALNTMLECILEYGKKEGNLTQVVKLHGSFLKILEDSIHEKASQRYFQAKEITYMRAKSLTNVMALKNVGSLGEFEYTHMDGIDERWAFLVYHLDFILEVKKNAYC